MPYGHKFDEGENPPNHHLDGYRRRRPNVRPNMRSNKSSD